MLFANHRTFVNFIPLDISARFRLAKIIVNMFWSLLLVFLKTLDNIDLSNTVVDNEENLQSYDDHQLKNNQLPPLVPLEFPAEMYENGAVDVLDVVKKKLENYFGETLTEEVMKIHSSNGVFDFFSKADFHNDWINGVVNNIGDTLKSKESPLTGISSKRECRKVCRKNESGIMKYLQRSLRNVISKVTDEDFRFEFCQDPRKSFSYTLDPETNQYQCKCIDEGYMIKVSPRLKELMEEKYLKSDKPLSELILEEDQKSDSKHFDDFISWKKMSNLGWYLTGWKSRAKRDVDDDIGEFLLYHGLVAGLLFVFCHCLFYFYLVYVFFMFLNDFVL